MDLLWEHSIAPVSQSESVRASTAPVHIFERCTGNVIHVVVESVVTGSAARIRGTGIFAHINMYKTTKARNEQNAQDSPNG